MTFRIRPALVCASAVAVVLGLSIPGATAAPPGSAAGTIVVGFETPDGVPGLVKVADSGDDAYATKGLEGTAGSVSLAVTNGVHAVSVQPVMVGDQRYVGVPSKRNVVVQPGGTTTMTVTYHLSEGVQGVHATDVTDTSIDLAWETVADHVRVRRTAGDVPATSPSQGTAVAVTGDGLSDEALTPGTRYNYSFWVDPGDSAHGVDQQTGPFVLSVGTSDPSSSTVASYVARPGTFFAEESDVVSVLPAADGGARVTLAVGVEPPAIGAAVVLPISETLRGGMLSIAERVSADGRVLDLVPGGMGDAFDYYHLSVDDISTLPLTTFDEPDPEETEEAGPQPAAKQAAPLAVPSATAGPSDPEAVARAAREAADTALASRSGAKAAASPSPADPPSTGSLVCPASGSAGGQYLDFTPTMTAAGHFDLDLTKHGFWGVEVPTGVSLDAQAAVTASGAIKAKFSASVNCQIKLPSLMVTIVPSPVPISFYLRPTVRAGVEGAISVSNLGVAVTAGFQVAGHIGLDGGNSISGGPIFDAQQLTPQVDAVSGGVFAKLGGTMLVGPGAGTSAAGAIAGVGGELTLLDAHANVVVPTQPGGSPCLTVTAGYRVNALVSARVWLSVVDFKADIPFLDAGDSYPGFPWYWPDKCDDLPNPSDDLLGDGVTKVEDDVTGSPDQWGYLDDFVPGSKAWVLSTGLVSDAQGSPDAFASTSLGLPGDTQLTSYSGNPTYDAGSYTAMLIPSGTTLHVRYAFASEEYPEYVGSRYNDVMGVFVDGENCAFVPGTSTPVSINSINDHTNVQYYVDNSNGAAGYNAVFDGVTVPLECSVPVTPGKPVSVRIALADASDSSYDSAVALLDGGIWSD